MGGFRFLKNDSLSGLTCCRKCLDSLLVKSLGEIYILIYQYFIQGDREIYLNSKVLFYLLEK